MDIQNDFWNIENVNSEVALNKFQSFLKLNPKKQTTQFNERRFAH